MTQKALTFFLLISLASCGSSDLAKKSALNVADVFLIALRDARWQTAFQRMEPALREACGGSPNELGRLAIARFEARLVDWRFRVEAVYGESVFLEGQVERKGRTPVEVGLVAENDGEQYRISAFEVDGLDLCPAGSGEDSDGGD